MKLNQNLQDKIGTRMKVNFTSILKEMRETIQGRKTNIYKNLFKEIYYLNRVINQRIPSYNASLN